MPNLAGAYNVRMNALLCLFSQAIHQPHSDYRIMCKYIKSPEGTGLVLDTTTDQITSLDKL